MREGSAPGPILLLGAPGVGKGTQAQKLVEYWSIPQISTGDLIRDNIQNQTPIGLEFKEMVAAGIFVPDTIVNQMVSQRLSEPDCTGGYILDGFPRTAGQATWLDAQLTATLQSLDGTGAAPLTLPLVAVSIQVRYDKLLRRVTGRRTGLTSKKIYNIYTDPPTLEGVCDIDGSPLVQRPDDTESVFVERMRVFEEQTTPVIAHYRRLGRFEEVDGEQPVHLVTEAILAALRRLRAN